MRWKGAEGYVRNEMKMHRNYVRNALKVRWNSRVSAPSRNFSAFQRMFYIISAHSAHFLQKDALKWRWHLGPGWDSYLSIPTGLWNLWSSVLTFHCPLLKPWSFSDLSHFARRQCLCQRRIHRTEVNVMPHYIGLFLIPEINKLIIWKFEIFQKHFRSSKRIWGQLCILWKIKWILICFVRIKLIYYARIKID